MNSKSKRRLLRELIDTTVYPKASKEFATKWGLDARRKYTIVRDFYDHEMVRRWEYIPVRWTGHGVSSPSFGDIAVFEDSKNIYHMRPHSVVPFDKAKHTVVR